MSKNNFSNCLEPRFLLWVFILCFFFGGCIPLAVGGGLVGGYIVSPDTVEGLSDEDEDVIWDTALEIVGIMGKIKEKYDSNDIFSEKKDKQFEGFSEGRMFIAVVQGAKVVVTVSPENEKTKLRVKARKTFIPKVSVAQEVFSKIMSRLRG